PSAGPPAARKPRWSSPTSDLDQLLRPLRMAVAVAAAVAVGLGLRLQVPPVRVIGRARALGRHHCRAERVLRRAGLAEGRAVVGLLQPPEHLAADADARFARLDVVDLEEPLGVVVAVLVAELEPALGDDPD